MGNIYIDIVNNIVVDVAVVDDDDEDVSDDKIRVYEISWKSLWIIGTLTRIRPNHRPIHCSDYSLVDCSALYVLSTVQCTAVVHFKADCSFIKACLQCTCALHHYSSVQNIPVK